jgi:predicted Zn-dependent protease
MRGYLFQGFGLRPESIAAYRRGLQIAPWQSIMRWRLAEVLLEMGELEEAAALLGQCAEENPQNPDVLTSWATCLFRRSEPERARELLEQLLGDSPDHFEARRLLGEIELGQGRFPEALEHLRSAARQRPNDMTTRNALGRVLQVLGRTDEAQGHFDYVVEAERALGRVERQLRLVLKRPDDAELRCQIGTALLKYGSPDDGAKWLRTVLQLQPDHPGAHQALAAYYEARGDWPSARAHRRSRGGK